MIFNGIIDRFEGDYAVLEHNGEYADFLKEKLPEEAQEGDLLEWYEGSWHILRDETAFRRKMLAERRRRMLRGNHS